jgi:hypothetical protein
MPFSNHQGLELFNDCLYFCKQARELMEHDNKKNVFEIRRALRFSLVALWVYWEYWLNSSLYSLITDKVWRINDPTKAGSIDERTINASVSIGRINRMNFDTKLDLIILLTGIDIRKSKDLKEFLEIREVRNRILHQDKWYWSMSMSENELLEKLNKGIHATRGFFKFWATKRGTKPDEYLYYEEPVDMVDRGYGYIQLPKK